MSAFGEVESAQVCVGDFSVAVASTDAPNEPTAGDVGEDLDGHDPLLLSHVPPVNPSSRTRSWRSLGDEVEASLGDEVASNDGVPFEWPKSNGSCVVTELPKTEYEAPHSDGNGQAEANFRSSVEVGPGVDREVFGSRRQANRGY